MTSKEDVKEIVQSFVDNDLASLDRIGGEQDTFMLSPHLAQPSPDLNSKQETAFDAAGRTQAPQTGRAPQIGERPDLKPGEGASGSGGPSSQGTNTGPSSLQAPSSQVPASQASHTGSEPKSSPGTGPDSRGDSRLGLDSKGGPEPKAESKAVPVAPVGQSTRSSLSPDPSSSESTSRHVSTSSTASGSTLDQEKRSSLGDRFKKFGKRITSGSRK